MRIMTKSAAIDPVKTRHAALSLLAACIMAGSVAAQQASPQVPLVLPPSPPTVSAPAAPDMRVDPQRQFLAENIKKPGWQQLPSGLQYRVVRRIAGLGERPGFGDEVRVHYRGTLIDGAEFDNSYGRGAPASFSLRGVIKGWQEALPMMRVGEQWELAIPADLGYGQRGQPGGKIPPGATLLFTVELLEVRKPDNTNLLEKPPGLR
jgi:FKBP-type peptidyl-prolyl cis-trans isomerase/Domain amino terminal to FKBP-type peptidyl-prolyl isomerase